MDLVTTWARIALEAAAIVSFVAFLSVLAL